MSPIFEEKEEWEQLSGQDFKPSRIVDMLPTIYGALCFAAAIYELF